MSDQNARPLWILAIGLALAVVVVVLIKAWPLLHPSLSERAPLNPDCDLLREACQVRFADGGEVRLDIEPRGIPAVRPLQIEVGLSQLPTPERVEVDFRGVDMNMGFNRVRLRRADAGADVDTDRAAGTAAGGPRSLSGLRRDYKQVIYRGCADTWSIARPGC
ncbi:MAG: hypothetical protein VBE63_19280 [Lamprobacter sp.]|uniref:hypothetical protein n=1 Tax=Lamprobacter sp. TaxID=3100796 RepID=UPI002B25C7DC|nr:hypothetical protein [Lamprobacter sp.]MEA3642060.1 hypothetical protein [Lamprobacter sp.]